MTMATRAKGRWSFWLRAGLAPALALLADQLLWDHGVGLNLALLAVALTAAVALTHPHAWRRAWPLLGGALVLGLLQAETPSLIGWAGFSICLAVAVLSARAGFGQGVWTWIQRLAWMGLGGLLAPVAALEQLALKRVRGRKTRGLLSLAGLVVLPLAGGLLFLALFSAANPVISNALGNIHWPGVEPFRFLIWGALGAMAFALLRPVWLKTTLKLDEAREAIPLPGINPASITLSLIVFNGLFALQNGLDVAFLWSGAALPEGMTLADYAHRGAYPLIFTALLAGLFVLVALAPGSETSQRPLVRRLVVLWVAQNLFLVASSILRTLDYIEAYSLTPLRLAALAWMGLVGLGLILICWRMIRKRTAAWLINANALAAGLVLLVFTVVDSGAVTADWNVRHAREVGGKGAELDVEYLKRLGPAALVPVARLEARDHKWPLSERLRMVRQELMANLEAQQSDPLSWTWRNHRRLAEARAIIAAAPPPRPAPPLAISPAPPRDTSALTSAQTSE
jgi:hypothetical protein